MVTQKNRPAPPYDDVISIYMADISPKVHELKKDEERKVKIKKRRNEEEYETLGKS